MPFSLVDTGAQLDLATAGTIFAGKVRHFPSVGSTNSVAMETAAAGAEEGTVILADEQTAGRGRAGHTWESQRDQGLYISVILRPRLEANDLLLLSLMTGLAAHAALEKVTTLAIDVRWPNDLMLGARKLGGILCELGTDEHGDRFAVVGVGINVNQERFSGELRTAATSLRIETGREWPRLELAAALLESLDKEYRELTSHASAARASILTRFEARSSYARGAQVAVDDHGAASFTGITEGLDATGFLRVRTADGVRKVLSGGVRKL